MKKKFLLGLLYVKKGCVSKEMIVLLVLHVETKPWKRRERIMGLFGST